MRSKSSLKFRTSFLILQLCTPENEYTESVASLFGSLLLHQKIILLRTTTPCIVKSGVNTGNLVRCLHCLCCIRVFNSFPICFAAIDKNIIGIVANINQMTMKKRKKQNEDDEGNERKKKKEKGDRLYLISIPNSFSHKFFLRFPFFCSPFIPISKRNVCVFVVAFDANNSVVRYCLIFRCPVTMQSRNEWTMRTTICPKQNIEYCVRM